MRVRLQDGQEFVAFADGNVRRLGLGKESACILWSNALEKFYLALLVHRPIE